MIARCSGDMLVDDFMELVAMREGVPVACFYSVGACSKALRLGTTLSDAWVVGHSLLFMLVVYEEALHVRDLGLSWLLALLRVRHGRVLASAEHVFSVSCAAGASTAKSLEASA